MNETKQIKWGHKLKNKDNYTNTNLNTKMSNIQPDYQLALLTFYTNINNKLNKMAEQFNYDKDTFDDTKLIFDETKNMIDKEMFKITNQLNTTILNIKQGDK